MLPFPQGRLLLDVFLQPPDAMRSPLLSQPHLGTKAGSLWPPRQSRKEQSRETSAEAVAMAQVLVGGMEGRIWILDIF